MCNTLYMYWLKICCQNNGLNFHFVMKGVYNILLSYPRSCIVLLKLLNGNHNGGKHICILQAGGHGVGRVSI